MSALADLSAYLRAHTSPEDGARAGPVLERFAPELAQYAELIAGPGGVVAGFMTRGEDERFTERVAATMRELELPAHALDHHQALASWFEHRRAFAKVEWHRGASASAPMVAVYFRRRPSIEAALLRLDAQGVAAEVQGELRALAGVLEKASVHFVSAAFQRAQPVQHKLYFSQLVLEERKPALEERLGRVFERLGLGAARAAWLPRHREAMASARETTLYVSFNFTSAALLPTFKIDYPSLSPAQVASWAAAPARASVEAEAIAVARAMGSPQLAYLGVRFGADAPRLKYYADQHGAPPTSA